ncbi:MAG: BrnT family toxin, partial [Dehalococcoidia bacterium]
MFNWDEGNRRHATRHSATIEEIEEALLDPRRVAQPAYTQNAERRRMIIGATRAGRILTIITTARGQR